MPEHSTTVRDVAVLKVARGGRVEKSDDPLRPFRLVDADGTEVAAVSEFLHHMLADDASPTSLRSYAYELLAWVRFLRAVDVPWYLASRVEEAKDQGWLGEVAAIETTMTAAAQKLEAMRDRAAQPSTVHLGMPDIRRDAGRSSTDSEY
jgi:hypothetical protein